MTTGNILTSVIDDAGSRRFPTFPGKGKKNLQANGQSALDAFNRRLPDLGVFDHQDAAPWTGIGPAARLRPDKPRCRCIFLTSKDDVDRRVEIGPAHGRPTNLRQETTFPSGFSSERIRSDPAVGRRTIASEPPARPRKKRRHGARPAVDGPAAPRRDVEGQRPSSLNRDRIPAARQALAQAAPGFREKPRSADGFVA